MSAATLPAWLNWAQRLQAIAQNGITFAKDPYDLERYQAIREVAAEILAAGSTVRLDVIRGLLENETGYATPKVDVRGAVFSGNQLLLVREKSDGKWTLPGGWADVCASAAENVEREIFEEAGLQTRAQRILAIYDRSLHPHEPIFAFHIYKIFLECSVLGGQEKPGSETDAVSYFDEEHLPELSITRITAGQIRRMFELHRHPEWPADFDLSASPHPGSKVL